jgi:hypothetical protein
MLEGMRGCLAVIACSILPITTRAQQAIPIRRLGPVEVVAPEKVDAISVLRPLSNGRLLIAIRQRVLFFDSSLTKFSVIADSISLAQTTTQIPLAAYYADSTLIVDGSAATFLVVDPNGKIVRAMAPASASDLRLFTSLSISSNTGADSKGRLIYRGAFPATPGPRAAAGAMAPPLDSFPIVRADFDTRTVDTLVIMRIPSPSRTTTVFGDGGRGVITTIQQPFPVTDAWASLPDGSVAIVRGSDYHVDWVFADGRKSSSPKMPFDWRRLTDDEKTRTIDSLRKFDARVQAGVDSIMAARGQTPRPSLLTRVTDYAPLSEMPDYYPPIRAGAVGPHPDGNLWVMPSTSAGANGGILFDVVNRNGEVFERVQLPPKCALAGLGVRDIVYLHCEGRLERRRVIH